MLQPSQSEPFPLTAKQLHYLVERRYVPLPDITGEEIWDKSNADSVRKFLAILQTSWMVVQTIGRAINHLPITPLELSTIVLAGSSLTTLGCWWHKALDVSTPTILYTNFTTASILCQSGEAAKEPFRDTPMDFVEPNVYISSKWSRHLLR